MMYEPIAAPRPRARIHGANCHCPRCLRYTGRADPRERRIRIGMFGLAAIIGGLLGYTVTPQDLAASVAATAAQAVR